MSGDPRDRLEQLLDAWFSGDETGNDAEQLERLLRASEENRRRFWERARLEQDLESWAGQDAGKVATLPGTEEAVKPSRRWPMYAGWAAAAALMMAWGLSGSRPGGGETPSARVERKSAGEVELPSPVDVTSPRGYPVAYLSRLVGVESENRYLGGQAIGAGDEIRLEKGLMELVFFSGARLAVEGPARFVPRSDLEIEFFEGGAEADVPESAVGFRLVLPDGVITDFGTSFDVRVVEGVTSRLQVIEGEIEIEPSASRQPSRRMFAGDALGFSAAGSYQTMDFEPLAVGDSLDRLAEREDRVRMARWLEHGQELAGDPALVTHFQMLPQERGALQVENRVQGEGRPKAGSIISASWSEGRWNGKPALSFRRPADRVRVEIPGEFPRATLVAWARVDGLPRAYNGLFYSEYNIDGEVHWQLSPEGGYFFGVRPPGSDPVSRFHRAESDRVISSWAFGSWRMFATTYDSTAREVVHYIDGREVSRTTLPESVPLRFGRSTLGNFFDPYAEQHARHSDLADEWSFRNWTGAIDEFMLFSRVLDPEELARLYQVGEPN